MDICGFTTLTVIFLACVSRVRKWKALHQNFSFFGVRIAWHRRDCLFLWFILFIYVLILCIIIAFFLFLWFYICYFGLKYSYEITPKKWKASISASLAAIFFLLLCLLPLCSIFPDLQRHSPVILFWSHCNQCFSFFSDFFDQNSTPKNHFYSLSYPSPNRQEHFHLLLSLVFHKNNILPLKSIRIKRRVSRNHHHQSTFIKIDAL